MIYNTNQAAQVAAEVPAAASEELVQNAATTSDEVEAAREKLADARDFLSANGERGAQIKKGAQDNVKRAEKEYLDALKKETCPKTQVEFWVQETNSDDQIIFTKNRAEIIIATSPYNMTVAKTSHKSGESLIIDDNYEKAPLYVVKAQLFYNDGIELHDLNGNPIPSGTPNVYVPVDTANNYWQWSIYHEHNINAKFNDELVLIMENVRVKEFSSLQDYAKYRGVNNMLSRGFNSLEKAGNAALATEDEFITKVYTKAKEMKTNVSVVTKYYTLGKTIKANVWNNATIGIVAKNLPQYDLSIGDRIIETLKDKGFTEKIVNHRYMIDVITEIANKTIEGEDEKIGIDETINAISSLSMEKVTIICEAYASNTEEIYRIICNQYEKNHSHEGSSETA